MLKVSDKTMVSVMFWLHFAVGTMSHVAVILLIGGALNLLWAADNLSFWTRGMMYGLTFFAAMYGTNHIANQDGFCWITDMENFYRRRAQMSTVGRYMPRYYAQVRKILRMKPKS